MSYYYELGLQDMSQLKLESNLLEMKDDNKI